MKVLYTTYFASYEQLCLPYKVAWQQHQNNKHVHIVLTIIFQVKLV